MKKKSNKKIISFTGYSGTGKTTFIIKLIKELKKRDLNVCAIKHDAHDFEIDKKGKDTYRYKSAGADLVYIFSDDHTALNADNASLYEKRSKDGTEELNAILSSVPDKTDVVIIEGCRNSDIPKIGMSRKATKKGLSMKPEELSAVITDEKADKYIKKNKDLVVFGLDDVKAVADYIEKESFTYPEFEPKKTKNSGYKLGASVNDVLDVIDSLKPKILTEKVLLEEANGRTVAKDYKAQSDFPPFKRSPLDGYAFRAEDTKGASRENPVTLQITEEIPAGKTPEFPVKKGFAAKILTGAPIPKGADVVERYEVTRFDDETVTLFNEYKPDTNIVPRGEDFVKGYTVINKGAEISCFDMGVLGITGVSELEVYRKPKVAFISTGSELVDVDEEITDSKIRNSSVYLLGAMAENYGAESIYCGIVKDDPLKIAEEIRRAAGIADVICTTGGASVGDYDLIMTALDMLGAKVRVWKVKMKPGMAFILAEYKGKVVLGLSGNPGAAAISFSLFGTSVIRKLLGKTDSRPEMIKLALEKDFLKKSPGGRYVVGNIVYRDSRALFDINEVKGNGVLSSLQNGIAVGVIPPSNSPLRAGTVIEAYLLKQ